MQVNHRRARSLTHAIPLHVEEPLASPRIQVFVRVRPSRDGDDTNLPVLTQTSNSLRFPSTVASTSQLECSFDRVFRPEATQTELFTEIQPLLDSGSNATMFAYGQTGSGKTHTMLGMDDSDVFDTPALSVPESWGLIPRCLLYLVKRHLSAEAKITIACTYIEIYNDKIFDLIGDRRRQRALALREGPDGFVAIQGITFHQITTFADASAFVKRGQQNRSVRETDMNPQSSRSHVVLQVVVNDNQGNKTKLNLVDLAGSEKWNKHSHGRAGVDIDEMKHINTSLSALGNCIAALTQPGRKHIPYRDSMLTRLLQDSLGGSTRTVVIATIAGIASEETIRTVQFASRARTVIQTAPVKPISVASQQLQKELAATQLTLAHLAQKVEMLTAAHQNQTTRTETALETFAGAVGQKLLEDDAQIHRLQTYLTSLATQKTYKPSISRETSPRKIWSRSSSEYTPLNSIDRPIETMSPGKWSQRRHCHDLFFALFYFLTLGCVLTLFGLFLQAWLANNVDLTTQNLVIQWTRILVAVVVMAWLWAQSLLFCRSWILWFSTVSSITCYVFVGILALKFLNEPSIAWVPLTSGILGSLSLVIHALVSRRQNALVLAYIEVAHRALSSRPGTLLTLVVLASGCIALYGYVWFLALCYVFTFESTTTWCLFTGLAFAWMWSILVLRHTIYVIITALMTPWWSFKTSISLGFVCSNVLIPSIGPICAGSFMLPFASTFGYCVACLSCLTWLCRRGGSAKLNRLAFWFSGSNVYSFIISTVYDQSIFQSGPLAMKQLNSMGWTEIAMILQLDLLAWSHCLATGCGGISIAWIIIFRSENTIIASDANIALMTAAFFVGFSVGFVIIAVLQAAIASCFVLFSKNPHCFEPYHQLDHEDLHATWNATYPTELASNTKYAKPCLLYHNDNLEDPLHPERYRRSMHVVL
ncbi:hypothetical protein LEN26_020369 [Aphanomyces euteiches]|nr:hypothetical protein LEN26_020369 [Aphanomyces euteiches]KAH9129439.1 hypothetical protein AeMF1_000545 [Aphanomyces euteiches]